MEVSVRRWLEETELLLHALNAWALLQTVAAAIKAAAAKYLLLNDNMIVFFCQEVIIKVC